MYTNKEFVSEMIPKKSVTLYKISDCSICNKALDYLKKRNISPTIELMEKGSDEIEKLMERTKSRTFPQIFIDSEFIGGFGDLKKTTLDLPTPFRMKEISGEIVEPMCIEEKDNDRFILFNGKTEDEYSEIYTLFKKQTGLYWVAEEIDISQDVKDWNESNENEKTFITCVLAFFASLDQIIMENIGCNFAEEIVIPQIRQHFAFQGAMEAIHGDTYAKLIQGYIKDRKEQEHVLRSIQTMPIIEKKALWVERWMNPQTASLAERLIGFTCIEGIQFSGSFCAIYWLKKQGRFKGLSHANSLIARDEGIHAEASVAIYSHLENKLPKERVHEIFRHAVDLECEFIEHALPVALIGINGTSMSQYIKFVADFWSLQLGYGKIYNASNPFEWMDLISLQGKTNFFENRVAEYSKSGVLVDEDESGFSLDAAF